MYQTKENPEIEWKTLNNKQYLYFSFQGEFSENDASNAVEKWHSFEAIQTSKKEIIWNCLFMKGYEPMARSIWQNAIKEHKNNIDKIWLISDSVLIQAGAKIMSIFTAFDIKVVKSEIDIVQN